MGSAAAINDAQLGVTILKVAQVVSSFIDTIYDGSLQSLIPMLKYFQGKYGEGYV
jgi:hypothetical protein